MGTVIVVRGSDEISAQRELDDSGNFYLADFADHPELEAQVTEMGLCVKRPGFFFVSIGREFQPKNEIRLKTTKGYGLHSVDNAGPAPAPDAQRTHKMITSDSKTQETLDLGLDEFVVVLRHIRSVQNSGSIWHGVILINVTPL